MNTEKKIISSVYRKIAIDIAKNIVNGKYTQGQRLSGRSVLASLYNVSPETIRKAVYTLKDVGILDIKKGSGIEVLSVAAARSFIEISDDLDNISKTQTEIKEWAQRQVKEIDEIVDKIQFVVNSAGRMKNISPFTPFEIKITSDSVVIGKTTDEMQFWHNTGGTIVAIQRGESLMVSPGPYAAFCEGDIFYIIGNDRAYLASIKLIFG